MEYSYYFGGKNMDLYEWTKHFIKYKDVISRRIKTTKFLDTTIHIEEKTGIKKIYLVYENLEEGIKASSKLKDEKGIIVTLNTKTNVDVLRDNWKEILKKDQDITILFAHPGTNEKWMIHPETHAKINEERKLNESLDVLFNSIGKV